MCYHQFLAQVESYECNGVLIDAPCRYCEPAKYARWKQEADAPRPISRKKAK